MANVIVTIILGYLSTCVVLYFGFKVACSGGFIFRAPKSPLLFYILSLTWGLPFVLFGSIVALFLRLKGYKPLKYGYCWCFEIPNINWGLELGLFFIAPSRSDHVKKHELGHAIQNIYLGIFMLPVISVPSAIRFWDRKLFLNKNPNYKIAYDDIWFEGSATKAGTSLIEQLKQSARK